MKRNAGKETVLYYAPENSGHVAKLKGVLVRMGVRIKNVTPEQVTETIGGLLGLPGFGKAENQKEENQKEAGVPEQSGEDGRALEIPSVTEEVLVMHNFSGGRLDELLLNLRKAGVPRIHLKAVVTETNAAWTFYQLYEEIKEEHEKMQESSQ